MEDALPSFLQTAWSYVVRDIDKTVPWQVIWFWGLYCLGHWGLYRGLGFYGVGIVLLETPRRPEVATANSSCS